LDADHPENGVLIPRRNTIASERVREGLKDVLLGPAQLYEALRDKAGEKEVEKA
jgi:hypothetical protein